MSIVGYHKGKVEYDTADNESGDPNKTLCPECSNEVKMERAKSDRYCPICGAVFRNVRTKNLTDHTQKDIINK